LEAFSGVAKRIVGISSSDVYRAFGVFKGTEPGPIQEVPLTEDAELRIRIDQQSKTLMGGVTPDLNARAEGY
jgi:hypothetical protein